MNKKLLSLVLAGLMLVPGMISCSDNNADETESSVSGVSNESAGEEASVLEYFDAIESANYNGATITIPDRGFNPNALYFSPVLLDDYYGDAFYDSIYDRQNAVADKMNIDFVGLTEGWDLNGIKNSILANAGGYDICFPMLDDIFSFVQQGLALDLNTMNVNTSNPYWNQNSVEDYTFDDKLYYGFPDINFDQYESMGAIFYNAQLLDNVGYESSLYDLWKEGKWTIDEMSKMMDVVISDISGDGKYTLGEDIFGLIGFEFAYLSPLYASGIELYDYDLETDSWHIYLASDPVIKCGEALKNIYFRENGVDFDGEDEEHRSMFKSGKALFYSRQIGEFKNLRDQEDDYGIINWPSMDGNTDGDVYVSIPYCMFIPSDVKDQDCVATAIELLAAYTYDVVIDNYINRSVVGKGTRDQQSAEIVRGMFERRAFDLEEALNIDIAGAAWGTAIRRGTYASMAKTVEKQFNKYFFSAVKAIIGE